MKALTYYLLDLEAPPTIRLAHGYTTESYHIKHQSVSQALEIAYIERGDMIWTRGDGSVKRYETHSLITIPFITPGECTSSDGRQTHFTVGLSGGEGFIRECSEDEAIAQGNSGRLCAILPEAIAESEGSTEYQKLLKKIIECHAEHDIVSRARLTSLIYELLASLTEYSLSAASNRTGKSLSNGNHYYRSAIKYIAAHLDSRIYVAEVAEYVGVSVGYLSSIFKDASGCTMVDYINKRKLSLVCEFIATKNLTLEEAGRLVAINDVKYLSRLFKRYNGITSEAYRAASNSAIQPQG